MTLKRLLVSLITVAVLIGTSFGVAGVVAQEGEEPDGENFFCTDPDSTHPVGEALAESYGVSYEEVMGWFCEDGMGFGQIMLALHTAEATEGSPEDYLDRRANGEGWGEIWLDLALIGPPEGAGPPDEVGPPEGAGPPDEVGPPEDAGPPEGAGPPDEVGPPEHAGPPDEIPPEGAGPPGDAGPPRGRRPNR